MPRNRMTVLLAAGLVMAGSARAQDDLAPPPRPPSKKLPPPVSSSDDLAIPPASPKKPAPAPAPPKKDTIDFPAAELPSDEPPAPVKRPLPAKKIPDRIAMPSIDEPAAPKLEPRPPEKKEPAAEVKLSAPITAQSTRPRKLPEPLPKEPLPQPLELEKAIPAPAANAMKPTSSGPLAESLPRHLRNQPKKTIEVEKAKPEVEDAEIIQAAAVKPEPKPQDRYELISPKLPSYDVVHAKSSPPHNADAIATVYERAGEEGGIIQVGATTGDGGAAIESYAVKIWKIDGWETWKELARMEYREESLAATLAKYNRSGHRPSDALPAGQKVRLPPKWVLERSTGVSTVARRPAPIRSEFVAPPATSVQAQPAGSGLVAASDRTKGTLTKSKGASPLPSEVEKGPIFVVKEEGLTLYKVAKQALGDGSRWREIHRMNLDRGVSESAPVKVGTRLRLPDGAMMR
jgi:protein TonB